MEENKTIEIKKETKSNIKSIWALCLGILGILGLYLLSYIAVVVGILAIQEINKNKEESKGMGLAVAGFVLGILGALANIGQHFLS